MSKLVSLSDDAYYGLFRLKRQGESFSKVVMRLLQPRKKSILDFAGAWADNDEMDRIFKEVARHRRTAKMREVDFN